MARAANQCHLPLSDLSWVGALRAQSGRIAAETAVDAAGAYETAGVDGLDEYLVELRTLGCDLEYRAPFVLIGARVAILHQFDCDDVLTRAEAMRVRNHLREVGLAV